MLDRKGNDNNTYNMDNISFIKKTSPKVAEFI